MMSAKVLRRGMLIAVFAFLLIPIVVVAAPPSPTITQTEWQTGQILVHYGNVEPGNVVRLYTRTHEDNSFTQYTNWIATSETGIQTVNYFENGQTVWFYITQVDPITNEESQPSITVRQTPPITAFVINWPDMFGNISSLIDYLADVIEEQNNSLKEYLDGIFTPSTQAMNDLQQSVQNLQDALGIGQVMQAGDDITQGINTAQSGMSTPIVIDDGNGTYTGGTGGLQLPQMKTTDELGLEVPNPDDGTMNDLSLRIPITKDMQGNWFYIKILTDEQLEKMKWLGLLRTIAEATIYIMFAIWLVTRFTPQLKS